MGQEAKEELARRVKAARAYAGLSRQRDLADAIKALGIKSGYSEGVIRNIEQANYEGERDAHNLSPIARACGLPVEFFFVDFARLDLRDAAMKFEQELQEGADTSRRRVDDSGRDERDRRPGRPMTSSAWEIPSMTSPHASSAAAWSPPCPPSTTPRRGPCRAL